MIPIWAFILACLAFAGILIHSYLQNKSLRFANEHLAHILEAYMDEFGSLTISNKSETEIKDE